MFLRDHLGGDSGTFDLEERLVYHADTSWASEIGHFLDAIEQGKPASIGTSRDALEVMRLIDRVYGHGAARA